MATPAFTTTLHHEIMQLIKSNGAITFRHYMQLALYHPQLGYYAQKNKQRVGKQGDFITSVSVGQCFGILLARRIISYWKEQEQPSDFHIIEPGAHDGALCADILSEIQTAAPQLYKKLHYHLIETTSALQSAQKNKLTPPFPGKTTTHSSLSQISVTHGAIISNELLDAFPVELIRFEQGQWKQLFVNIEDNQLSFIAESLIDQSLENFCSSLGNNFPDGYTTEYNPGIEAFTADCSKTLSSGLFITIDYGHESEELYHPARHTGTLQTYHQHQKADNPLLNPGEIDITTHIDFTRLIHCSETEGFTFSELTMQSSYLTKHARDWLIHMETAPSDKTPILLRQFQTLTHPSMLGTKFMVLEMEKKKK